MPQRQSGNKGLTTATAKSFPESSCSLEELHPKMLPASVTLLGRAAAKHKQAESSKQGNSH